MGSVISLEEGNIEENELLKRFSGTESISENDPYWNKLFSFNFNIKQSNRAEQKKFCEKIDKFLETLLKNTLTSNNFVILIKVFLRRLNELESSTKYENKIFLWQTANGLIIIRYICVFFAKRLSTTDFVNIFQIVSNHDENSSSDENDIEDDNCGDISTAENFLLNLVNILCNIPINDVTLSIHHETIRVILSLLSSQLYNENVTEHSVFLRFLMQNRTRSISLVKVLLENYIYQTTELPTFLKDSKSESLVITFASSMWSAFKKGVQIDNFDDLDNENANISEYFPAQTLASLSSALLLNLVCYPFFDKKSNPYKEMLSLFQNAQEVSSLTNLEASFKVDFTLLYERLCSSIENDKLSMLLLYMILHNSSGFRNFILSRINLEILVVPCIKVLNNGVSYGDVFNFRRHSHQTYLALIVLLILSEDDFFCKIIHETKLKNITWYQQDRSISEITLGSLIVLVFVKIIHINTDRYLHTNSMAALANLSSFFKYLSPFVCQKFLGLLETMTKRQAKLISQIVKQVDNTNSFNEEKNISVSSMHPENNSASEDEQNKILKESLNQDISALEEGIRNILEIINACLINNLRYNIDLIYSILYKRELFEIYRNHPFYEDLMWNIYTVINHFTLKIEVSTNLPKTDSSSQTKLSSFVSVINILEIIKKAAIKWPTDRLHKFPDLKFKYIEDDNTLDFFIPYVWRLIYQTSLIYFNSDFIKLYNVNLL